MTEHNIPVLCIPYVEPNITESHIRETLENYNLGTLERIDIVHRYSKKGEHSNRVFVHFSKWNDTENAIITRERLLNGLNIKIPCGYPRFFWKISAYREPERSRRPNPKPIIRHDALEETV